MTREESVEEVGAGESASGPPRAPPPAWLDTAFVQAALRCGAADDCRNCAVETIEVQHASAPGDNYCSCIYRVTARVRGRGRGRAQPLALLVKGLPEGERWARVVLDSRFFAKEGIALARVLPAMETLLEEAAPARFPPFAARCLRHGDEPSPFVVLLDLRPEGFVMADRHVGLELPQALVVARALGRLHGASAALWRRRPELFRGLVRTFDEPNSGSMDDYYVKSFESIAKVIMTWDDFPGEYGHKIMLVKDKILPKIREINRVRTGKLNVLIHGDFWTNNILFRHVNNEPRDVRFVDFQVSHVGNPAIDLIVLHCTSLTEEVFDEQWESVLNAYSDALGEVLLVLGEEAHALEDIRGDLEEARAYWFMAAFIWMPVARLDKGKFDLNTAMGDESYDDSYNYIHKSPSFCRWLRKVLPTFIRLGVFNGL